MAHSWLQQQGLREHRQVDASPHLQTAGCADALRAPAHAYQPTGMVQAQSRQGAWSCKANWSAGFVLRVIRERQAHVLSCAP